MSQGMSQTLGREMSLNETDRAASAARHPALSRGTTQAINSETAQSATAVDRECTLSSQGVRTATDFSQWTAMLP